MTVIKELSIKNLKLSPDGEAWEHIDIDYSTRLFYKANEKIGLGFEFMSASIVSYDDNNNKWSSPDTTVEVMYHGEAYFDGIRHLYMGSEDSDNDGYDYYANLTTHIKILSALRELELKYCSSPD